MGAFRWLGELAVFWVSGLGLGGCNWLGALAVFWVFGL